MVLATLASCSGYIRCCRRRKTAEDEVVTIDARESFSGRGQRNPHLSDESEEEGEDEDRIELVRLDDHEVPQTTHIVDSKSFGFVMILIVLVNLVTIGLETDFVGYRNFFSILNSIFLLVYIGELTGRLLVHGIEALQEPITVVDCAAVSLVFAERVLSTNARSRSLISLRLLRVVFIIRKFKLVSLPKEASFLASRTRDIFLTVMWVSGLVTLMLIPCATLCYRVIGESGEWRDTHDPLVFREAFTSFDNVEYFGGVMTSILTLMQVTTLAQWADLARPIMKVYPVLSLFFFLLIILTNYGIFQCIVANMCQASMLCSREVEKAMAQTAKEDRIENSYKVLALINLVDENKDGELSAEELDAAFETLPEFEELLNELEVPVLTGEEIVRMFDKSGDGLLSYKELQVGITDLNNPIKTGDFTKLTLRIWAHQRRAEYLSVRLERLQKDVRTVKDKFIRSIDAVHTWMDNRGAPDLILRARKHLRSNPEISVPVCVDFMEEQRVRSPRDRPADRFISLANRFLGDIVAGPPERRQARREDALRGAARAAERRELLPSPPPPMSVAKERAQREDDDDPYRSGQPIQSKQARLAWVREMMM